MFSIMTNPTAIGAQSAVTNSNNTLSKTIQQLSTGLRINSSADDASGMAVSEKLRGQISGLKVAARNAQDGISLLQTAEANMGTMTSMVQRIRELAVQAGDPAYTSTDRVMLQTEVDQLKQEINRVSSSAEFNTKKLLNGDAAALWSSTGNGLDAIIKGATAQGNYKLDISSTGGDNAVYKSNPMSVADAAQNIKALNEATFTTNRISSIQHTGMMATQSSAGATGPFNVQVGITALATGAAAIGSALSTIVSVSAAFGGTGDVGEITGNTAAGYYEIEQVGDRDVIGNGRFRIRFTNATTGVTGAWAMGEYTPAGNIITGGTVTVSGGGTVGTAAFSFGNANTAGNMWKNGNKAVYAYNAAVVAGTAGDANVTINTGGGNATGGATLGINMRISGLYSTASDVSKTVTTAQWDAATNSVVYGKMTINTVKGAMTPIALAAVDGQIVIGSKEVSGWTSLGNLKEFINADGINVLSNTQELTMYGNGTQATLTLEAGDSINDFLAKMRNSIKALGMDGGIDLDNLVQFATAGSTGNLATPNTIVFQGGIMGKNSEISFSGNQGVIDGLGIAQIKQARDAILTVGVSNAHTGVAVSTDTVSDGILRNAIKNVDIVIDQKGLSRGVYADGNITFGAGTATSFLHLVNNATVAAIGANEGQTLDISIGRMDTVSLGIDSVNVLTIDAAQKAITQLDLSLDTINKGRAIIGAQMNRLNYTINNLNVSRENMMAAESRIRDLDIAEASSNLAAQQVRLQAATAMLAQANQLPSYAAQLLR